MIENIEGRVVDLIRLQLVEENREIMLDDRLVKDLNADSLDMIEIQIALEEEFCIDIDENDFQELKTVQDIIIYIQVIDNNGIIPWSCHRRTATPRSERASGESEAETGRTEADFVT